MKTIRERCALLILGAAVALAGCQTEVDPSIIRASGHVEATDVRVATKLGGTLEWFEVDEGDRVTAGQQIARLETVDAELALETARADRATAETELALVLAGFRQEDIAEARAQVDRASAELGAAHRDLRRFQALLDRGSGTEKSRDDAQARVDVAEETVRAARARLEKLEAGFRSEEIESARARVAAAAARIAQVEQQIVDSTVVSPVGGLVTEKLVEEGEVLPPGTPLFLVTDLENAWLTAYIEEPDLGRIRLGQDATVITDDGLERPGRVTFVASEAEFTPKNVQTRDERVKLVYRIKVSLDNADGTYKPGMPAEVTMTAQGRAGQAGQ